MSNTFNYEADQVHDMVHPNLLTDTAHYVPECKDILLSESSPNYPKLTDYESEWLYFYENIYQPGTPVDLEYQEVIVNPYASVTNAIPYKYKSAIFKGKSIKNYKNNLFDNVLEKGTISISTGAVIDSMSNSYRSANFIPINGKFIIAKYGVDGDVHICFYDGNKRFISNKTYALKAVTEGNATVTPPTNSRFIKFYNPYNNNEPTGEFGFGVMAENEMIELEIQSVKAPVLTTSNEDGSKSNILTVNEEVELRGIGEVQDTLDLMTGELTQRVSGLEGIDQNSKLSQSGTSNDTTLVVTTSIKSTSTSGKRGLVSSHELIKYAQLDYWFNSVSIIFKLPKANENFATLANFKQYLTQNPFYYYRELEKDEISTKTVDLNAPLSKPYEGTNHFNVSSDTITPLCELSVPIESTGAQTLMGINQED